MSEQVGALVKESRIAAGMTQKELAEAVDGLSAKSISEAERGLRELTDDQLAAIAEATASESLLDDVGKDESPATPPTAEAAPTGGVEDILKLFNAAVDPAVKEAVVSVLKAEEPQSKDALNDVLPTVVGMLGSNKGGDPLAAIIGFLASKEGRAFLGSLKGIVGNVTDMLNQGGAIGDIDQEARKALGPLLVFTFLYSVAIYILLLSFYFWLIRTDIKPQK